MCHPVSLFLSSSPLSMASSYPDQECEDFYSRPPRSRASSRVSVTADQFGNIQIADSPRSLPSHLNPSSASLDNLPSSTYNSPIPPHSAVYPPASGSQTTSPFPILSPEFLNVEWSQKEPPHSDSTPLLRVDPVPDLPQAPTLSPHITGATSSMR